MMAVKAISELCVTNSSSLQLPGRGSIGTGPRNYKCILVVTPLAFWAYMIGRQTEGWEEKERRACDS